MDEEPKKKKGFAGYDSLGSDISIDAKAPVEDDVEPENESGDTASVYAPKQEGKSKKWWWIGGIALIVVIAANQDNKPKYKPSSYTPPATTASNNYGSQPAIASPELSYEASFTDTGSYRPKITVYKHTADYTAFMEKHKSGEVKDYKAEYRKFSVKSNAGDLDAMYVTGLLSLIGKGTKKDENEALINFYVAATNGQPDAAFIVGILNSQKDPLMFRFVRQAALQGLDSAQVMLGDAYLSGSNGMPKDSTKAMFWYQQAAEQRNPKAEARIGTMYYKGDGVSKDERQAFAWALRSANQFDEDGCGVVAAYYADGSGVVAQNNGHAYYWLTCADKKKPEIQKLSATIDAKMQLKDYITAAQLGSRLAMVKLAKDYHFGVGVQKSNFEAQKYMQMFGFTDNEELVSLKDSIRSEMTADEITRANDAGDVYVMKWIKDAQKIADVPAMPSSSYYNNEVLPSVGSYPNLTLNELRWCVYQGKRMDYMNAQFPKNDMDDDAIAKSNAEALTQEVVAQYNEVVNDTNARCPNGRKYPERDMQTINRELADPIYISQIELQAQQIMKGWSHKFIYKTGVIQ